MSYVAQSGVYGDFAPATTVDIPSYTPGAGACQAMFISWGSTTVVVTGVTDDKGNSWTPATSRTDDTTSSGQWWVSPNAAAGATVITITFGSSIGFSFGVTAVVHSYSGRATSSPVSGTPVVNFQDSPGSGSNAVTSGNLVVPDSSCDLMGASDNSSAEAYSSTPGAGWTMRHQEDGLVSASQDGVSAATYTATFTATSGGTRFITGAIALKQAGGGGRTTKNTRATSLGEAVGMELGMQFRRNEAFARAKSGLYVPKRMAA